MELAQLWRTIWRWSAGPSGAWPASAIAPPTRSHGESRAPQEAESIAVDEQAGDSFLGYVD